MKNKSALRLFSTSLVAIVAWFSWKPAALAQNTELSNRVNLEDVDIQGEANKNQALFLNRNKFEMDDRVKLRKDFRREMEDAIPASFERLPAELIKDSAQSSAPQ